jgi:hypothetical protein
MPQDLPACLRGEKPPARWDFEFPIDMVAGFDLHWTAFFSGTPEPLLAWMLPAEWVNADENRFRQRWQERDGERMTEFAEGLSRWRSANSQEDSP